MSSKKFKWRWLLPQYYPLWVIFGVLYIITKWIPFAKPLIASCIGHLLWMFSKKIKRIVLINIQICMPKVSHEDRLALAKKIFIRYGYSLLEIAQAWFASNDHINKLFIIEGENHLIEAQLSTKPILLGTAHFTCLELGLAKASTLFDHYAGLYRPSKNDLVEYVMYKARMKRGCSMIAHNSIKELIKRLKQKFATVYLPDQPELTAPTDLLNFFGNPCITNLALSKIARISGAIILPMCMRFDETSDRYVLSFEKAYEPSNDERYDTQKLLNIFEAYIRLYPEQYLWGYKKVKGRPLCFKQYY
jgi:KDO2-lipid IV(A) lauroyltransferase